ncbi:Zn-ribbon domain-containing OB-fold protein [Streptomyces odontomachi]|uniref:Zn-ribbon domain-containing OB-fold protein n=1 Tax=Streptomyces odontomachi TaxID=2944940 RepID=UPI00210D3EFB|nr:OB-fold domain-containing protein [Streptomyces sp. ODS25]
MDTYYCEQLSRGIFSIPQCTECGQLHFYPRVTCPFCHSFALRWTVPSGRGVVYSTTVVRRKNGDHNVALVDLEEGPRLMSRVVGVEPHKVVIGMPVEAAVQEEDGEPLLVFVAPRSALNEKNGGKGGRA